MVNSRQLLNALRANFEPRLLVSDPDMMAQYRNDQAPLLGSEMPLAVVRVQTIDDVVRTVQISGEFGVPIVTRGAGTGLSGGANAIAGGIVLSMTGLNSIVGN